MAAPEIPPSRGLTPPPMIAILPDLADTAHESVSLDSIELDSSIQCRAVIDTNTVHEYAEEMARGANANARAVDQDRRGRETQTMTDDTVSVARAEASVEDDRVVLIQMLEAYRTLALNAVHALADVTVELRQARRQIADLRRVLAGRSQIGRAA